RRTGARVGTGALPQPPPGRIRRGRRDAHPSGAGGDARRGAGEAAARRPRAWRRRRRARAAAPSSSPPRPHVIAASILHALGDPWSEPIVQRAGMDMALLGVASGALGCWIV